MDAQDTRLPAFVREDDRCFCALGKGEVMNSEQLPLSVAMRADELTEQDFDKLYARALEMQAEQEEAPPRKIPMGKRVPVTA